jgi:hypothetical protein
VPRPNIGIIARSSTLCKRNIHRSDALGCVHARHVCEHAAVKPDGRPRSASVCTSGWLSKEVYVVCLSVGLPADRPAQWSPAGPHARKLPRLPRRPPTRCPAHPTLHLLAPLLGAHLPQLRGWRSSAYTCRSRSRSRGPLQARPTGRETWRPQAAHCRSVILCRLDERAAQSLCESAYC